MTLFYILLASHKRLLILYLPFDQYLLILFGTFIAYRTGTLQCTGLAPGVIRHQSRRDPSALCFSIVEVDEMIK